MVKEFDCQASSKIKDKKVCFLSFFFTDGATRGCVWWWKVHVTSHLIDYVATTLGRKVFESVVVKWVWW